MENWVEEFQGSRENISQILVKEMKNIEKFKNYSQEHLLAFAKHHFERCFQESQRKYKEEKEFKEFFYEIVFLIVMTPEEIQDFWSKIETLNQRFSDFLRKLFNGYKKREEEFLTQGKKEDSEKIYKHIKRLELYIAILKQKKHSPILLPIKENFVKLERIEEVIMNEMKKYESGSYRDQQILIERCKKLERLAYRNPNKDKKEFNIVLNNPSSNTEFKEVIIDDSTKLECRIINGELLLVENNSGKKQKIDMPKSISIEKGVEFYHKRKSFQTLIEKELEVYQSKNPRYEVLIHFTSNFPQNEYQVEIEVKGFIYLPSLILYFKDFIFSYYFNELKCDEHNLHFQQLKKKLFEMKSTTYQRIVHDWIYLINLFY